jgi:hypothetical protein
MLKTFWIVLAFVLASSMTARAQSDIATSPSDGQNASDQLKYAMGAVAVGPGLLEYCGTIEPKLSDRDGANNSAAKRLTNPTTATQTQNQRYR